MNGSWCTALLWIVPAKVASTCSMKGTATGETGNWTAMNAMEV